MPLLQDVDLERLASVSHGFVGADLEYLCKEAAMKTLRRMPPELNLQEERLSPELLDKLIVTGGDFENALKEIVPSAMREVYLETPDVKWSEIGGLEDVKRELQEAVEWPLKFSDLYKAIGYSMPKGVLHSVHPGLERRSWPRRLRPRVRRTSSASGDPSCSASGWVNRKGVCERSSNEQDKRLHA